MLAEERRQHILSLLRERGYARTMDLARRFNVSDQTIRRDLQELAASGHVSKSHGGGSLINWGGAPFSDRTLVNREEKLAIAEAASRYVRPGMTVVEPRSNSTRRLNSVFDDASNVVPAV